MAVRYPNGADPMRDQPMMQNYNVKPASQLKAQPFKWHLRRKSKYNAKKVYAFHTWFDSKAEVRFYCLLLTKRAEFVYHHKYLLHPHEEYPYHGHTIKLMKRSYTTDFVIWKAGQKRDYLKPYMVVDVKGGRHVTVSANRQMDDFSRKYHIPVVIARYNYRESRKTGMLIFDMHIRGTSKHDDFQEMCSAVASIRAITSKQLERRS